MQKKQEFRKGFTIIELLIVIAVIAVLIAIALPRFRGMREEGDIARAKGELRTLQAAIESYYSHNNHVFPATGSAALNTALSTAQPRIIGSVPVDPFDTAGGPYQYILGGTNNEYYVLYSVGTGRNGSAALSGDTAITETNGASCIYVSNISSDTQP